MTTTIEIQEGEQMDGEATGSHDGGGQLNKKRIVAMGMPPECQDCGSTYLEPNGGCLTCQMCGWSKCG